MSNPGPAWLRRRLLFVYGQHWLRRSTKGYRNIKQRTFRSCTRYVRKADRETDRKTSEQAAASSV